MQGRHWGTKLLLDGADHDAGDQILLNQGVQNVQRQGSHDDGSVLQNTVSVVQLRQFVRIQQNLEKEQEIF